MKTDIYKVTIYKHDNYHQVYRFVGRVPTKEELLDAIGRRKGNSLRHKITWAAQCSTEIITQTGIPEKTGVLSPVKWSICGVKIGKVTVEREDAWTLDPEEEK